MLINRKKGETVHMYTFTGMYVGEMTITEADKKTVTIQQKNGRVTVFDRATGIQIGANIPRCSSRISEEPTPKAKKPDTKKNDKVGAPPPRKKKASKPAPDDDYEDEDENEDDDEEEEKPTTPAKKATAKKPTKPVKPAPAPEDEDDDDEEYEDA